MKAPVKHIIFEITSLCNLDCMYCYNIWKRPGVNGFTHYNSYKQALRTLKRIFKVTQASAFAFTGGEPLLAERLPELALFCRIKGASVTMISNGNAGNRDDYKTLTELGVGLFELPLHSHDPEMHDRLTRRAGSHEKSLRSIRELLDLGANVTVDIVLNKMNIDALPETLAFIKSIGIDRVMLTRFNIGGEGIRHLNELTPGIADLREAFHQADVLGKKLGLSITSNVCTPLCLLDPREFKNINTTSCSASAVNMPFTVDILGRVRVCNHSPVHVGNIYEDKLEDLINCEYLRRWRETVPEYCAGCDVFDHCYGGCRAAAEQMGLGCGQPDPILTMDNNTDS